MQPLRVGAPGFVTRTLEVDPARGEVQVRLELGARVEGWVTRADGTPSSEAYVYALGETRRGVQVGEDGGYVLDGLPPGATTLFALGDELGAAEQRTLVAGESVLWSPAISRALGVRGVLMGPDGVLADWRIELRAPWNPGRPISATTTGADGGFEVEICPPGSSLHAAPPGGGAPVASRPAEGNEVLLRWTLGPEHVRVGRLLGSLVRADGTHVPPGTGLLIRREGDPEALVAKVGRHGRFESPPLGPGRWYWMLPGEGLLAGPEHPTEVHSGDLDLGVLVLGAVGTLHLAAEPGVAQLRLERSAGSDWIPLFDGRAEVPARIPLAPGLWRVTLGEGWPRTVLLPPGGESRVE